MSSFEPTEPVAPEADIVSGEPKRALHPFEWVKLSESTWERGLDYADRFYEFMHVVGQGRPDLKNWYTTIGIKIKTQRETFAFDVKSAWVQSRYEFPNLSARIQDGRWIYESPNEQDLASWLQETFHVHEGPETAHQLFPFKTNPSQSAVLHVVPRTQELVIQAPHTHIDAIGAAVFFKRLCEIMVAPLRQSISWGGEGTNLMPGLAITAEIPPYTEAHKAQWKALVQEYLSSLPSANMPTINSGAPSERTKNQWMVFSADETTRIVRATKEKGISVTAAAQAACSRASRTHGKTSNKTHGTMIIYDGRGYVDPTKYPHDKLVGAYVFALAAVYPIYDDFLQTAKSARQVMQEIKKDDFLRAVNPFWSSDAPGIMASAPPASDLILSSVGNLDKYLPSHFSHVGPDGRAPVEVEDIWISLENLSPSVGCEVWTFRGKLNISLMYNETYRRDETVAKILSLLHEELSQGLGVSLGFDIRSAGREGPMASVSSVVTAIASSVSARLTTTEEQRTVSVGA